MHRAVVISMAAIFACGCGMGSFAAPWSEEECIAHLLPGDLVITEVMTDPGEGESEWFEVYNASGRSFELAGLHIQVGRIGSEEILATHSVVGALAIAPAGYAVLGAAPPGTEAAHLDYRYRDALGDLPSRDARLALRCDVIEVDAVELAASSPGAAMALSTAVEPDHEANNAPESWCSAMSLYTPGNAGTPGAANDCTGPAGGTSGQAPALTCTEGGRERMPVTPQPGDLVITEVMANPTAVDDAQGEWFEVFVAADVDVDLNGVAVGRAGDDAPAVFIDDSRCLRAAAGSYVLLGRSGDSGQNGGLPSVFHELDVGLINTGGSLALRLPGPGAGILLDEVAWSRDFAGAAHSLDPSAHSPADNDVAEAWCKSAIAYGAGDYGTPGMENPRCFVPAGMCLDGKEVRPLRPPTVGNVFLTEVMPNPASPLADADAEWLEIYAAAAVDLNGLEIGVDAQTVAATLTDTACLPLAAGSYGILARSADPQENGSLPAVIAPAPVALRQGSESTPGYLFIGLGGAVIDELSYTESHAGRSVGRSDSGEPPSPSNAIWCSSEAVPERMYSESNYGTPGQANPPCPGPTSP